MYNDYVRLQFHISTYDSYNVTAYDVYVAADDADDGGGVFVVAVVVIKSI